MNNWYVCPINSINCLWQSPACFKICYDASQTITSGKAHTPKEEMCCYCVAGFNDWCRRWSFLCRATLREFDIVKATCACTTMGCLILVSCLSIWGCSSLHSITKVFRDIRRFSFHYVSGYRPLCTYSLKIKLHGLHHIDRLGAVFSCSNMML